MFKFSFPIRRSRLRDGVTLVELLVVVAILSIVTAAAIPLMAPATEARRLREASRGLSTFLVGARARAIDRNRSVGVEFAPLAGVPGAALEAYYVEVPPMYGGDTTGSTAEFTAITPAASATGVTTGTVQLNGASAAATLVNMGDQIQFNYQGPWWTITGPGGASLSVELSGKYNVPWVDAPASSRQKVPFQIRRQPARTSTAPFQLPGNVAIDLQFSSTQPFDPTGTAGDRGYVGGVKIMFAPEGHVANVYNASGNPAPLSGAIYLLVGGAEKIPVDLTTTANWTEENCNLLDGINQWVAINTQSGQAISSEMTYIDPTVAVTKTVAEVVTEARRLASDMRGQGGK